MQLTVHTSWWKRGWAPCSKRNLNTPSLKGIPPFLFSPLKTPMYMFIWIENLATFWRRGRYDAKKGGWRVGFSIAKHNKISSHQFVSFVCNFPHIILFNCIHVWNCSEWDLYVAIFFPLGIVMSQSGSYVTSLAIRHCVMFHQIGTKQTVFI